MVGRAFLSVGGFGADSGARHDDRPNMIAVSIGATMFARPSLAVTILAAFAVVGCGQSDGVPPYTPETDLEGVCMSPLARNEPLCNEAFGDTLWAGSHRGSYAQGSSPFSGPTEDSSATSEHIELDGAGVPVILSFTKPYDDGGRAAWSTITGLDNAIMKIDHESFEIIDTYIPADREEEPPGIKLGVSGAYTAIDSRGHFIVGRTRFVSFFGDGVDGDRFSPIALEKRIFIPGNLFCNEDDRCRDWTRARPARPG